MIHPPEITGELADVSHVECKSKERRDAINSI